jgi:hypothetical protein
MVMPQVILNEKYMEQVSINPKILSRVRIWLTDLESQTS